MARLQCHECGFDGHAEWHGELICPRCGCDYGVRAAIGIEEMTEADADLFEAALNQWAKEDEEECEPLSTAAKRPKRDQ